MAGASRAVEKRNAGELTTTPVAHIIPRLWAGPSPVSRLTAIATRILTAQAVVGAVAALAWWGFAGAQHGLSALAGAVCVVLPGGWFALKQRSRGPGSTAAEMLGAFYRGAAIRLVMVTVLIFVLVPLFTDALVPFVTTLVAALAVQWVALLWKS